MLCLRVNDVFPDNVFIVFIKLIFSSRLSAYLDKISSLQFSFRCELDPYLIMHDYALRARAKREKNPLCHICKFPLHLRGFALEKFQRIRALGQGECRNTRNANARESIHPLFSVEKNLRHASREAIR